MALQSGMKLSNYGRKRGSVVERKRESHCRWRGDWWMHTLAMLSTFEFQVRFKYISYDHTKSCQCQFLIPFNGASKMAYCITSHRRKCVCTVDSEYLGESQEFQEEFLFFLRRLSGSEKITCGTCGLGQLLPCQTRTRKAVLCRTQTTPPILS